MENYLTNEKYQLLSDKFYQNSNVNEVAMGLLSKVIVTNLNNNYSSGLIVETEAYAGVEDKGCHSFNGRRTSRTEIMYALGGLSYVYICYGMHPMMNVVTGHIDEPKAVLIRAIQPLKGIELMQNRRNGMKLNHSLSSGPAKAAVALGIDKNLNGVKLNHHTSSILIFEEVENKEVLLIEKSARVGMSHHVGVDAYLPYRYYLKGNPWVSKPLFPKYDF